MDNPRDGAVFWGRMAVIPRDNCGAGVVGAKDMASPTGLIPEEWMYPQKVGLVMDWLKSMPVPGHDKRTLLQGWARTVGAKISASQYEVVERTGIDQ
jgi:hypothetical protein